MKRDFTQNMLQELLSAVQDTSDKELNGIYDHCSSPYSASEEKFSHAVSLEKRICQAQDGMWDLDSRLRACSGKLERLFGTMHGCDLSHAQDIRMVVEYAALFNQTIRQVAELLSSDTVVDASGSLSRIAIFFRSQHVSLQIWLLLRSLTSAKLKLQTLIDDYYVDTMIRQTPEYQKLLNNRTPEEEQRIREELRVVLLYERDHEGSKQISNVDEFVSPLELRDQIGIKAVAYQAKEPYRSLFLDNCDKVKFERVESYIGSDGKVESGFGYYSPGSKTISIDFETRDQSQDPRGSYSVVFHEFGHYLDDEFSEKGKIYKSETYQLPNGKTLRDTITDNTRQHIYDTTRDVLSQDEKVCNQYTDRQRDSLIKAVYHHLVYGNLPGYEPQYNGHSEETVRRLARKVQAEYQTHQNPDVINLNSPYASGVSDAYDGVTNYTRDKGNPNPSGLTGKGVSGNYQHDDDYWYDKDGNRIRSPESEAFAQYYAEQMLDNQDAIKAYEYYLGKDAREGLDLMIADMAK